MRVKTNKGILPCTLKKEDKKTVWVTLPDGHTIKRHKEKHVVEN